MKGDRSYEKPQSLIDPGVSLQGLEPPKGKSAQQLTERSGKKANSQYGDFGMKLRVFKP